VLNIVGQDIFDSAIRSPGDLAGVFEYDGETGYFYLFEVGGRGGARILSAIHIVSGPLNVGDAEIDVRWDESEDRVGLFIRNTLSAVFNVADAGKYGGDYDRRRVPSVPRTESFQ
jgi:hypothetical protein